MEYRPVKTCNSVFIAAVLTVSASLSGCIQYPMGLTRQQWESLPPAQQADFQTKQYAIDEQNRQQTELRRIEQQRLALEREQTEKERIRQLYVNARYGEIVRITVQGGFLEYNGKRYPYEPVSVDLVKGETKKVTFYGRGNNTLNTTYNLHLTDDGNTVIFDDSFRARIVMVNQTWERGQSYRPGDTRNDVSVGLSGMSFFVKFKELAGAPQRIIIEHR